MLDVVMRSSSLLNPCQFKDNQRAQAFVNSDQQSYTPGGTMQFSLPVGTNLDMTDAYIDFNCSVDPTGRVSETTERYELKSHLTEVVLPSTGARSSQGANGGFINFLFDGEISPAVAYNATPEVVYNALASMKRLVGRGYKIYVEGTTTFQTNGYIIVIYNFDKWGMTPRQIAGGLQIINGLAYDIEDTWWVIDCTLEPLDSPLLSTPRLERFQTFFDYVYIQIDNETVYNLTDANILEPILVMLDSEFSSSVYNLYGAGHEFGLGFTEVSASANFGSGDPVFTVNWITRQLRIGLQNIDLFKHILPLKVLGNRQLRLYMHLDSANRTLVCSTSANTANQSFTLAIPKLQYHKLILSPQEEANLLQLKNSPSGIVIPFRGWSNYKQPILVGSSSLNIIFNPSQANLLGIFFTMFSTEYAANATNHRKLTTFLKNNIGNYRLKVGSVYFPLDAIRSSTSQVSNAEMLSELRNFSELVKYQKIDGDLFAFNPLWIGSAGSQGTLPTDYGWIPWDTSIRNQTMLFAIGTSDIGYNDNSGICNYVSLNGVDAKSLANVQLELNDMTVVNQCQIDIFYLHQDYLVFKGDDFKWLH